MDDILARVEKIVYGLRQDDTVEVGPRTDLFDSGILDSLRILEFITELEQQFRIQLANEDLIPQNLWSIETTSETVRKYLRPPT
jgi:acyl carrier protein